VIQSPRILKSVVGEIIWRKSTNKIYRVIQSPSTFKKVVGEII
jgi:hypothetical protein